MSREEREEVREFIKEQLRKEYIQPSKSPQMAPVFFVVKKDRKKRMVQDYRYLNKWTVKNDYLLPLISDVLCYGMLWTLTFFFFFYLFFSILIPFLLNFFFLFF